MAGALNSVVYRPIDQWPGELTRDRKQSPFSAEFRHTIRLLSDEVDHLTDPAVDTLIVVQLALSEGQIRKDQTGLHSRAKPEHPGVVVSFESNHGPLRFSCDRFDAPSWRGGEAHGWRHNLRAIALGLEALRKVDRYGIGTGAEQYRGFGALPPATPLGAASLTLDEAARLLKPDDPDWLLEVGTADDVRSEYRFRVRHDGVHPDQGGDPETFRRYTAARDLLLSVIGDRIDSHA